MLSVCMIVKNEEKILAECLKQVVRFADELVIADTGSSDATKEIASRFTDKVYDLTWTDDFSEARNRSFSYATGDYVMWVDADHIIDDEAVEKLTALKKELSGKKDRINSVCVNYLSPDNLNVPVSFHMIMRRGDGRKWCGAVHERYPVKEPVLYADITIRHAERKEENTPVNMKSIVYRDYISRLTDDEFRGCFWLGMQCYVDLIFASEAEEAERVLKLALENKPDLQELLRVCLLAGNNFLYWKRYEDALKAYEMFLVEMSTGGRSLSEGLGALPTEIRKSSLLRMLLQKAQKCAYESGETSKAIHYNEALLEVFPDCISARLNKNYYDSFISVTVSVCMIVRDEEPVLERVLGKVKQFADELIVVDTGSKDHSKEIALRYADKVFDYVWDDDFAAARNYSYEQASCDYIMWLDADDDLEPEDMEKLKYLKQHFPPATDVLLLYYTGDPDEEILSGGGLMRDRWIRRSLNGTWEYPIHEAIPLKKEWNKLFRPDIRVFHRKVQINEEHRNIRIFERRFKEGFVMNTYNRSYYVRELATEERYEEAGAAFEEIWEKGCRRDIDYALIFYIESMKRLRRKAKLRDCLERYTERFGSDEIVYCALGDCYRGEKRYEDAVRCYRMALGLQIDPRDKKQHFPAYHDFLPWIGLAKTFLCTGDTVKAADALQHAERSHPEDLQLKILKLNLELHRGK